MMSYSPSRASFESDPDDDEDDVLGNGENTVQSVPESNNNRINGNKKKGRIFGIRLNFGLARLKRESEIEDGIRDSKKIVSRFIMIGASLREFSYSEVRLASDGFSTRNKIGSDGFGDLYKGELKCSSRNLEMEDWMAVTVKVFHSGSAVSMKTCITEMQVMNELRHANVVRLMGWGQKDGQVALVYEYLPNDTLCGHLHGRDGTRLPLLPWNVWYWKIALGLARALIYIQEGLDRCVVHRDVKSSNVFLDSDFNPKLGGFGLAIFRDLTAESVSLCGTRGYMDPDIILTGRCTSKSDIYGFGVVALEIATGKMADGKVDYWWLPRWVHGFHEKGAILEAADPRLGDDFDRREMEQLLLLGLLCTNTDPNLRPSASLILRYLNFEEQMPLDPNFYRFSDDLSAIALYSSSPALSTQTPEEIPNHADSCFIEDEAAASWIATFDIGIPPHYYKSTATADVLCQQRQDYHLPVLYGMVDSLAKMFISEHERPSFDKVLDAIRTFTAFLVKFVPPPLDDWDALAQLILQKLSIKESSSEMENYNSCCSILEAEASIPARSSSSLEIEIEKSALSLQEDEARLKDANELLARKREECSVLEAKLQEASDTCRSIEEEAKAIEQRVAPALATLEQKRRLHAIIKRFESALSPL